MEAHREERPAAAAAWRVFQRQGEARARRDVHAAVSHRRDLPIVQANSGARRSALHRRRRWSLRARRAVNGDASQPRRDSAPSAASPPSAASRSCARRAAASAGTTSLKLSSHNRFTTAAAVARQPPYRPRPRPPRARRDRRSGAPKSRLRAGDARISTASRRLGRHRRGIATALRAAARAIAAAAAGETWLLTAAGADLFLVTDADDPRSDDDRAARHRRRRRRPCPPLRALPRKRGLVARTKMLELFREAERRWPSKLYFAKFDADSLPIPHHLLRLLDEMHAALGAAQPWLLDSAACRGKSASGSAQTFSRSATCHAAGGAGYVLSRAPARALGEAARRTRRRKRRSLRRRTPRRTAARTPSSRSACAAQRDADLVERLLPVSARPVRNLPAHRADGRVCAPVELDARLVPHDRPRRGFGARRELQVEEELVDGDGALVERLGGRA